MGIYESAVQGRRDFREAFRIERGKCNHYRDALDRIARFEEAFEEVIAKDERGQVVGGALAAALAAYARRVLDGGPLIYPTEPLDEPTAPEPMEKER